MDPKPNEKDAKRWTDFFNGKGIIALYIASIYASLPLLRDLQNFLYDGWGREVFAPIINTTLIIVVIWLVILSFKIELKKKLAVAVPLILVSAFMIHLEVPIERLHFLQYGLLGLLVVRNLQPKTWFGLALGALFVTLVGAGDEGIQYLLPRRYGDLRDVLMNASGGVIGIWIGKVFYG